MPTEDDFKIVATQPCSKVVGIDGADTDEVIQIDEKLELDVSDLYSPNAAAKDQQGAVSETSKTVLQEKIANFQKKVQLNNLNI